MSSLLFNYFLALFGRGKDYAILLPCSRIGHKHSRIFLKKKFAIWAKVSYVVSMIKTGTIAITRTGGIYQVEKTFHDAVRGMVAVCRVYRSQKRVGIRVKGLRPHPLFS